MVGAKTRRRKSSLVLDEIEKIIGYGFERINIADDLFTSDKERVREICAGIKERSLKFKWSAFARVDTVNQESFDQMAEAGCDRTSPGYSVSRRYPACPILSVPPRVCPGPAPLADEKRTVPKRWEPAIGSDSY